MAAVARARGKPMVRIAGTCPIMIAGAGARRDHDRPRRRYLADQTLRPSYSSTRWDGWDGDPSYRSGKGSVAVN